MDVAEDLNDLPECAGDVGKKDDRQGSDECAA